MQSYSHLTLEERESLAEMLREGISQRKIAEALCRNVSSISRELKRNRGERGEYHPYGAEKRYRKRRKHSKRRERLSTDAELRAWVENGLSRGWSPEQIVGSWKLNHLGAKLSFSTIYRALRARKLPGYSREKHLRRHGKRKYANRSRFNTIQPEHTIHDRPAEARELARLGDFEGDTIRGAGGKNCLFTAIEPTSLYLYAAIARDNKAVTVGEAMKRALGKREVLTLTLDNGSEFAAFREVEKSLHTTIYFADPHSPWQRGCNENINGVLRFFFPKGFDFSTCSQKYLDEVLDLINSRPRKSLGWFSPKDFLLHFT